MEQSMLNEKYQLIREVSHRTIPVSEDHYLYNLFKARRDICHKMNEYKGEEVYEQLMETIDYINEQIKKGIGLW